MTQMWLHQFKKLLQHPTEIKPTLESLYINYSDPPRAGKTTDSYIEEDSFRILKTKYNTDTVIKLNIEKIVKTRLFENIISKFIEPGDTLFVVNTNLLNRLHANYHVVLLDATTNFLAYYYPTIINKYSLCTNKQLQRKKQLRSKQHKILNNIDLGSIVFVDNQGKCILALPVKSTRNYSDIPIIPVTICQIKQLIKQMPFQFDDNATKFTWLDVSIPQERYSTSLTNFKLLSRLEAASQFNLTPIFEKQLQADFDKAGNIRFKFPIDTPYWRNLLQQMSDASLDNLCNHSFDAMNAETTSANWVVSVTEHATQLLEKIDTNFTQESEMTLNFKSKPAAKALVPFTGLNQVLSTIQCGLYHQYYWLSKNKLLTITNIHNQKSNNPSSFNIEEMIEL